MLLVPLLFMLAFATTVVIDKWRLTRELAAIQDLSGLSIKVSQLVHELQKERGMSAGLLGSKGAQFGSELLEQRASTDRRIAELRQSLQTVATEKFGGKFTAALKAVLEPLDQLESLRKAISALAIEPKKAIDHYSNLNADFLNLIAHTVKGAGNSEIAIAATAYLAFLQSKEKAGIERAVLNNTFARRGFAAGMFNQFSGIVAAQDVYLGIFKSLAEADQKTFFQNTLVGQSVVDLLPAPKGLSLPKFSAFGGLRDDLGEP